MTNHIKWYFLKKTYANETQTIYIYIKIHKKRDQFNIKVQLDLFKNPLKRKLNIMK